MESEIISDKKLALYKTMFWWLVFTQTACSQIILWRGLPVYNRLKMDMYGASDNDFAIAIIVLIIMQLSYWFARPLQKRINLKKMVVAGHFLLWIGELSLFFVQCLAAVVLFDRFYKQEFTAWKFFVLVVMLFSMYCYKDQLKSLGNDMLDEGEIHRRMR